MRSHSGGAARSWRTRISSGKRQNAMPPTAARSRTRSGRRLPDNWPSSQRTLTVNSSGFGAVSSGRDTIRQSQPRQWAPLKAIHRGAVLFWGDGYMLERPRARVVSYGLAVLAPAACLLVRWPLWPLLRNAVPHMTFFPAVVIAAYFGGFGPGLVATVLSAIAANYFLTGQLRAFRVSDANDVAGVILFVLTGTIISVLSESLHRAQ